MENCLFCQIAKKKVSSQILYEDDEILAFLDIDQNPSGHTLVIPKKHFEDYTELDSQTLWKMFEVAKKLQDPLMKKLKKPSNSLLINYGDAQVIKHVHLHLMPHGSSKEKNLSIQEVFQKLKNE